MYIACTASADMVVKSGKSDSRYHPNFSLHTTTDRVVSDVALVCRTWGLREIAWYYVRRRAVQVTLPLVQFFLGLTVTMVLLACILR